MFPAPSVESRPAEQRVHARGSAPCLKPQGKEPQSPGKKKLGSAPRRYVGCRCKRRGLSGQCTTGHQSPPLSPWSASLPAGNKRLRGGDEPKAVRRKWFADWLRKVAAEEESSRGGHSLWKLVAKYGPMRLTYPFRPAIAYQNSPSKNPKLIPR